MAHTYKAKDIISEMIYIPEGSFLQGSSMQEVNDYTEEWGNLLVEPHFTKGAFRQWIMKEYPAFRVSMKPFYMGKYPVTNEQYAVFINAVTGKAPESISMGKPAGHPVWGVTLDDIIMYIHWLKDVTGQDFGLPSEAEWEYAARGPQHNKYPFGNTFNPACCNTLEAGIGDTTPVRRYEQFASGFGICDMAGNVEEWTSSNYQPYPGGTEIKDDLYEAIGASYPVLRGGSFFRGGDLAGCARRHGPFPSEHYKYTGFRLTLY